jgi:hypothetical protein
MTQLPPSITYASPPSTHTLHGELNRAAAPTPFSVPYDPMRPARSASDPADAATHAPARHVCDAAQAVPHAPQLVVSVESLVHVALAPVPQASDEDAGHPQAPPLQT